MAYIKTSWVARVGTALNRFLKTNETSTEVELTNDPTGVTTAGTPFTVDNMNKIEQGIYDAHYPAFTEAETLENIATGEEGTTLWGKVKKAIATVLTHDGYLDQGVKTTDTVGFVNIKPSFIPALNAGDVTIIPGIAGSTSGTTALNTWVDVPSGSSNIKFDNALAPNTAIYSYRMNIYFGMVNHGSPSGKIRVKKNGIVIYTSGSITAGDYSTGVYVSSIDVVYNIADVFTFEVYRTTTASGDHSVRIYCDFGVDREYTALENKLGNLILI